MKDQNYDSTLQFDTYLLCSLSKMLTPITDYWDTASSDTAVSEEGIDFIARYTRMLFF